MQDSLVSSAGGRSGLRPCPPPLRLLQALADGLPAGELAVYATTWPGDAAFDAARGYPVHRHPTSLMLPVPDVARRAAALAREHGATTVWFGARVTG